MNEAEIWRAHADKDLAAVRVLLNNGLNGLAAFHAQQAVEKALKARLLARQGQLPRIHDLVVLGENSGLVFTEEEVNWMEELNVLYTSARYPGGWGVLPGGQPSAADIQNYIGFVERLLNP
jgi:HEPN domain-containing protein